MRELGASYRPIWDPEAAGPVEVGIDVVEIGRIQAVLERFKVLGTGVRGVRWRDIEVLPNGRGKPIVVLYDTAAARDAR